MDISAAHNLLGVTLQTGWKVISKITKEKNSTGAFFSVCYIASKDEKTCFLKAFDFAKFQQISGEGKPVIDIISEMTKAFKYERDLSVHCQKGYVTKVAFVIDSGEEFLRDYPIGIVPYLVFELADGDVRSRLQFSNTLDFVWKLSSLHDIAIGMKQLHNVGVSHQDLKPSNVLIFNEESKLGDLGRSMCKSMDSEYNSLNYSGDWNYAPPEMMYQYYDVDWYKRTFATDCYLLGSLIVFYLLGISMSALLLKHMPQNLRWECWQGTFDEVKPYLLSAYSQAINEFHNVISGYYLNDDICMMVEQLCHPFPEQRGHPRNIQSKGSNYNLERYISKLDLLKRKVELKIFKDGCKN